MSTSVLSTLLFGLCWVTSLKVGLATGILIETTKSLTPLDYKDCEHIEFEPENFVTCICLKGVWAFHVSTLDGLREWRILSGADTCIRLDEWVSHVQKISNKTTDAVIKKLDGSNLIIVANKPDWEVNSADDDGEERGQVCFPGSLREKSYCLYSLKPSTRIFERTLRQGCSTRSRVLKEIACSELKAGPSWPVGSSACALIPPEQIISRKKRQNAEAPPAQTEIDDETKSPEELARRMGNPDMMTYISGYVVKAVSKLIEDSNAAAAGIKRGVSRNAEKKSTPTQSLLELCNAVAQRICNPIQPGTLDITLNTFLGIQTHKNKLKEPYIAFTAFQRILESMERCKAEARAVMFVSNETSCQSTLPTTTSEVIISGGEPRNLTFLPDYAVAKPGVHELVTEVVWKTFLMAHSFCFRYFSDYYNDHHTFTTAMMPFFTNAIQETWENSSDPAGGSSPSAAPSSPATAYNYTTDQIWYGDLLGNVGELFQKIDYCYAASRFGPPPYNPSNTYPWYMKRPKRDPANEWIPPPPKAEGSARKKRSAISIPGRCDVLNRR